jgi:hypothetical protein
MTKQEREKIRQEIAKKYKDRITELELENQRLKEMLNEEHKQRVKAENTLYYLKNEYEKFKNAIPESMKNMLEILNVFNR